jgi:hypothetical protein
VQDRVYPYFHPWITLASVGRIITGETRCKQGDRNLLQYSRLNVMMLSFQASWKKICRRVFQVQSIVFVDRLGMKSWRKNMPQSVHIIRVLKLMKTMWCGSCCYPHFIDGEADTHIHPGSQDTWSSGLDLCLQKQPLITVGLFLVLTRFSSSYFLFLLLFILFLILIISSFLICQLQANAQNGHLSGPAFDNSASWRALCLEFKTQCFWSPTESCCVCINSLPVPTAEPTELWIFFDPFFDILKLYIYIYIHIYAYIYKMFVYI